MTTAPRRSPSPWWIAVVSGMASYIDSAAIVGSGTAIVLYQHSIGLTALQVGVLSALLTFSIAVGAIFGGRLGDRFGRRAVFIVTMATIVVGAALLALSGAFPLLVVGSALMGLGTGADLPVSLATVSEAGTERNRGRLVGFTQVLWYAGIIGTTAISIGVGDLGELGGRILFAHVGVVALIVLLLRLTVPESASWQQAQEERRAGATTVRARRAGIRDILGRPAYLVPFLALLGFYALTNIGANTSGQFGTYTAVNVAHLSVPLYSTIQLIMLPVGVLLAIWFLRIADGRFRMLFYAIGAVGLVVGFLVPAIFGFSLVTIIVGNVVSQLGFAFSFEAIMKIWTQESFPTLLRASAQGAIIAIARVIVAVVALFMPLLLAQAQLVFAGIAVVVAIGLVIGWLGFRHRRVSTFELEGEQVTAAVPVVETSPREGSPA